MAGKVPHIVERNGNFYARLVVPKELRGVIGKSELRKPLGRNRSEATKRSHEILAEFHRQIDAARELRPKASASTERATPIKLDLRPFDELARLHYRLRLAVDEHYRNAGHHWASVGIDDQLVMDLKSAVAGSGQDHKLLELVGPVMELFEARGHHIEEFGSTGWRTLARKIALAELEALRRVAERDKGDFTGSPDVLAFTQPETMEPKSPAASPVSVSALFSGYIAELAASGRGREAERRWKAVFDHLKDFLSHDDAAKITPEDLIAWKESLLRTHAPKTVRDVYIAALKSIFGWAKQNRKLSGNPAAELTIKVPKKIVSREKGFTDKEANALLTAAANYKPKLSSNPQTREGRKLTLAKRWVPWICAHTGARVAEITQLRKGDVQERDGIWFIRITSDAGSVKSGHYRDVPLHEQLIERGFLKFVEAAADGPLFYDQNPTSTAKQHPAKAVAGRISTWIRDLGVIDLAVDPNHGWRHRFKSVALESGVDARVADAIQGHAPRTAGENYGSVTLKARRAAIDRMPAYDIPAAEACLSSSTALTNFSA